MVAGQPHQRQFDQAPVEARHERRLLGARMPCGCRRHPRHPHALSLRSGAFAHRIEGRVGGIHLSGQQRPATRPRTARQRPAAGTHGGQMNRRPGNLNRTRPGRARCVRAAAAPHAPIPLRKCCGRGKLASNTAMPFEYFTALSRDPLLWRLCHRLGVVALLLVSACFWSAAQETNSTPLENPAAQAIPAQAPPAQATPVQVAPVQVAPIQTTDAVAVVKPVSPTGPVNENASKTPPEPAKVATSSVATSKTAPASPALTYDSLRIIADRNIFNASRSKGFVRSPNKTL